MNQSPLAIRMVYRSGEFRRRLGKVNMATIGFTQTDRALQIETPLGPDVLLLRSVSGQEAISQLFRFQLELLSETDDSISFDSIVGKNVTIHLQTHDPIGISTASSAAFPKAAGRALYLLSSRNGSLALVPDPQGRLPYLPASDCSRHHQEDIQRTQFQRLRTAALRPVPASATIVSNIAKPISTLFPG